jgi:hypothetical protein
MSGEHQQAIELDLRVPKQLSGNSSVPKRPELTSKWIVTSIRVVGATVDRAHHPHDSNWRQESTGVNYG